MNTDEQKNAYLLEAFKDVGQAMKELREHNGLTIEEAAERIGRTPGKVVAMEKGVLFNNVVNLCKTAEALGGRLAILPTDNPGLKHCEFIAGPPVKKPHPCHGCDHYRRTDSYCDFWKGTIDNSFKCTNQKTCSFIVPQSKN